MEPIQETQEALLAELRGLRGELAEVLKHLPRRRDAQVPFLVQSARLLDRALLTAPHTFQCVLALVLARLAPTAPQAAGDQPSKAD